MGGQTAFGWGATRSIRVAPHPILMSRSIACDRVSVTQVDRLP